MENKFPKRLRELRKSKGLSQKDFGDKFNLAESTISGYEIGTRNPSRELRIKFADFFGVSLDELEGRNSEKKNFFYFDKDAITEEDAELLENTYEIMRERARKRAEEKKNKNNK